ncbi:MAG: prephenate dehydratase [Clostridiales bacterium]|nr:prephenate dehydratase [Clostridiales bacterium]
MELSKIREQIDSIDDKIASLYDERMKLVGEVSEVKKQSGKAVSDPEREKKILLRVAEKVDEKNQVYLKRVFETIFETSKAYQTMNAEYHSEIGDKIDEALKKGELVLPAKAKVACQGVSGAYSGIAADRLFELADITYFKNFDGVFQAVEKGFCKYGVLPIENSSAGSVNQVYDLMKEHKFYIVRSIRLSVSHNLIVNKDTKLSDIKEIISHEQALSQCKHYLEQFKDVKITAVANTAVAARTLAESGRHDVAAISSRECAELYGLKILQNNVQDSDNNYTRFILIAKDMEFYQGAQKISIMTTLPQNSPGSLNKLLSKFSNLGINLTKLESRPIVGSSFEFMFYFDFECNIKDKGVKNLLIELDNSTEQFTFLGAYREMI